MSNFSIHFVIPWLLLLLIPALFLTLFPYFRLDKRYRRTRNRIISMSLHIIVMTLAIFMLSGMTFEYDKANYENEILLVVDCSDSSLDAQAKRDEFIQTVLNESGSHFKIGVVTFGYNSVYAAPISDDPAKTYERYRKSLTESPVDGSATDVGAALDYASTLFTDPATSEIILISDGVETDGDATIAARRVAARGTRICTVSSEITAHDEVQLTDIRLPENNIALDEQFGITLSLNSSYEGPATLTMYDGGVATSDGTREITLREGAQEVNLNYAFTTLGLHEISFGIVSRDDTLMQNNTFVSYINLNEFKNVLIIERYSGESKEVHDILVNEYGYVTETVCLATNAASLPATAEAIGNRYQQVVLVNVSPKDLATGPMGNGLGVPSTFAQALNSFVNDLGGGVFTVGGFENNNAETAEPVAHAFRRSENEVNNLDVVSAAQISAVTDMLPIEAVDYKPPMGLVIIIDRSGSMLSSISNTTYLDLAKDSAVNCLKILDYSDYVGVLTLEDKYSVRTDMVSMTQRLEIERRIADISDEDGGGTMYYPALERAYQMLRGLGDRVARKHIIIITDGQPGDKLDATGDTGSPPFGPLIDRNYDNGNGITLSPIIINNSGVQTDVVDAMATRGGGNKYLINNADDMTNKLMEELQSTRKIVETSDEKYQPTVSKNTSIVKGVNGEFIPEVGGFFGVREKSGVETSLMAPFAPLYTQWRYGNGRVGAFMCSLNGDRWSSDFISSTAGRTIVGNIVQSLMPTSTTRKSSLRVELTDVNYTTNISIITQLREGETIEVEVASPSESRYGEKVIRKITPDYGAGQSRVSFSVVGNDVKKQGIHKITVRKLDASGNTVDSIDAYRAFSYSKEYDVLYDAEAAAGLMTQMAVIGRGDEIDIDGRDVSYAFTGFATTVHRTVDPRLAFGMICIILFLLDIAVRKFKFKWIHEIIRDRKEKKSLSRNKNGDQPLT